MKIYVDEDSISKYLLNLLRKAKHDVQGTVEAGNRGLDDCLQLVHAILNEQVILTKNYDDYSNLHLLVQTAQGTHPGIFLIRKDDNTKNDFKLHEIVRAIAKLEASGHEITNGLHTLNHWR